MKAIIFPGQGSQKAGMVSEFQSNFKIVKDILDRVDNALKFSLSKIILNGTDEDLKKTEITQPAILTTSFAIFSVLKQEFNFDLSKVKYLAGHSLGEYSALVSADALAFEDAIFLVFERGKAMQEAVPVGQGGMLAVLGTSVDTIKNYMEDVKKNGVCEIANDNADGQIIISGKKTSVDELQKSLKEKKIKCIPLKVSAPFHCTLMKPAAEVMRSKINNVKFKNPSFKIVNNVTAKIEVESDKIKKLLIEQIFSTVKWRESLINMTKNGENTFIEIGPGKALTGMVKRTVKGANCFSINTIEDIKNLINEPRK